jgi:ABC-type histidine transport system ATPase subunit
MLFDEITSALDPELVGEVLEVRRELAREEMTMLTVTHEMPFAREVASRLVFMDQGVVVEQGNPKDLFPTTPEIPRKSSLMSSKVRCAARFVRDLRKCALNPLQISWTHCVQ